MVMSRSTEWIKQGEHIWLTLKIIMEESNSFFFCETKKKKYGFVENNKEKASKSLSFIKDLGLPLCRK